MRYSRPQEVLLWSFSFLLAAESLQVPNPLSRRCLSLTRRHIQQQARLIATLGDPVSAQIQIRQNQRRCQIALAYSFPQPLRGLSIIAGSALIASIQIFLRGG
jgi:hypothetical protein